MGIYRDKQGNIRHKRSGTIIKTITENGDGSSTFEFTKFGNSGLSKKDKDTADNIEEKPKQRTTEQSTPLVCDGCGNSIDNCHEST